MHYIARSLLAVSCTLLCAHAPQGHQERTKRHHIPGGLTDCLVLLCTLGAPRDIKSANVLLTGDERRAKIGDVGLAQLLAEEPYFRDSCQGTFAYAGESPAVGCLHTLPVALVLPVRLVCSLVYGMPRTLCRSRSSLAQ